MPVKTKTFTEAELKHVLVGGLTTADVTEPDFDVEDAIELLDKLIDEFFEDD